MAEVTAPDQAAAADEGLLLGGEGTLFLGDKAGALLGEKALGRQCAAGAGLAAGPATGAAGGMIGRVFRQGKGGDKLG